MIFIYTPVKERLTVVMDFISPYYLYLTINKFLLVL